MEKRLLLTQVRAAVTTPVRGEERFWLLFGFCHSDGFLVQPLRRCWNVQEDRNCEECFPRKISEILVYQAVLSAARRCRPRLSFASRSITGESSGGVKVLQQCGDWFLVSRTVAGLTIILIMRWSGTFPKFLAQICSGNLGKAD